MAAPVTPDEWLPILAKRLDARQPRIALLRSYASGDAPMPEMSQHTREAWQAFQRKSRGSFAYLISSALVNRIVPIGVTVGGSTDTDQARAALRIWRDNRVVVHIVDALTDAAQTSVGYLVTGLDESGKSVITREAPEFMIAAMDPLRPWSARAALKVWRDSDAGVDHAYVWAQGSRQHYARPIFNHDKGTRILTAEGGDWEPIGEPEMYAGSPPVVVLENRDSLGEYERHLDLIDRINLGVLNRMVVIAMQAFRQRALMGELPRTDEDGNEIEWDKVFEPAPGALWEIPDAVKSIWESQPTDPQPLLSAVKDDLRDLSAVSETPLASLVPDGANQTAEGAAFQREAIVSKAADRIARFKPAVESVMVDALRLEGIDGVETVEVLFQPPDRVSMSEKYAAAAQAKAAGESWKSIARNVLGYSPDQIRQDALDRAEEQLAAAMFLPPTVNNAQQPTADSAQ